MTPPSPLLSRKELDTLLGGAARAWLDEALAEAAHAAAHGDTAPAERYAVPRGSCGTPPPAGTADSNTPTPYAPCCSRRPRPGCPP